MNKIVGVELSHKFAPIAVREQLAFNRQQTVEALRELKSHYPEVFIISTCNRLSLYALGDNYLALEDYLNRFGNYSQYLTVLPDNRIAVNNLFSTAAGLESQAIGEHQIVGQIRDALDLARKEKSIGPVLDELIRKAIHAGKRARMETSIGKHSASLATVGFELIRRHGYQLEESSILLVGTGNMANLVNTVLDRSTIKKLYVASHNRERAQQMAEEWNGEAIDINRLHHYIYQVDIIIGGTQGEVNLLSEKDVEDSKCTRAQFAMSVDSPKLLIDFGLPRNFNPVLKSFDNIRLYDLDDIKKMTFEGLLKRYEEIPQVEKVVKEEEDDFTEWFYSRKAAPIIEAYLDGLNQSKEEELKWLLPKMGDLDEHQQLLLQKFAHRLIRKVSKKPLKELSNIAQNLHHTDNPINTVKKVFDLPEVDIFVPKRRVIVGTRGSKLALTQTHQVIEQLKAKEPSFEYVTKIIRTSGDDGNIEVMGAFTTAIQRALLDGEVDLAVHSYKDLPIEQVGGLKIGAVTEREDVRDVFISSDGLPLVEQKTGAVIGTGSLRRQIQLKLIRPDIEVKFIQGNLDSRIQKMRDGDYDAILLAAAGLKRLGSLSQATEILEETDMIPAVGQGALAIEIRSEDEVMQKLASHIHDVATARATAAERAFLTALGGGCNYPIAAFATANEESLTLRGLFADEAGDLVVRGEVSGRPSDFRVLAIQLAANLQTQLTAKKKQVEGEATA